MYTYAQVSCTPARKCHIHLRASVYDTCAQVYMTPARRCYGLKFVYFSETCVGGPQNSLEVANIEVVSMVEVEVFKEKQSFVSSKGMGSAARGWVAQIASRQNRAQSPGMHARLLRVRDDLLQLPQLL